MQIDPAVSRRKFATEIERLTKNNAALQERGIFVLGTPAYPFVDMLFVPRRRLGLALPPGVAPSSAGTLTAVELPSLSAKAFRVRFDLTDYDLQPPSVEFRDGVTNKPLDYPTMFRALEYDKQRGGHVVLLGDHPITHQPFLCIRGIREYHNHPQHSGDQWMLYRDSMTFFSIVLAVWRVCVDIVRPVIILQPNGMVINWNVVEKP